MSQEIRQTQGPTHACPVCGEWFDVEHEGRDTWFVSPYENEAGLGASVWTEAANTPVCPFDSSRLETLAIERI